MWARDQGLWGHSMTLSQPVLGSCLNTGDCLDSKALLKLWSLARVPENLGYPGYGYLGTSVTPGHRMPLYAPEHCFEC